MTTRITVTTGDGGLVERNAQQQAANRQGAVVRNNANKATADGTERRRVDRIATGRNPTTGDPLTPPVSATTLARLGSASTPGIPRLNQQIGASRAGGAEIWRPNFANTVPEEQAPGFDYRTTGPALIDRAADRYYADATFNSDSRYVNINETISGFPGKYTSEPSEYGISLRSRNPFDATAAFGSLAVMLPFPEPDPALGLPARYGPRYIQLRKAWNTLKLSGYALCGGGEPFRSTGRAFVSMRLKAPDDPRRFVLLGDFVNAVQPGQGDRIRLLLSETGKPGEVVALTYTGFMPYDWHYFELKLDGSNTATYSVAGVGSASLDLSANLPHPSRYFVSCEVSATAQPYGPRNIPFDGAGLAQVQLKGT